MSKKKSAPKTTTRSVNEELFVVGIGASAGGVEALLQFFEQVPSDSGMAYVVILHLSPDYDSQLTELLQRVSSIPVVKVNERITVTADQVYVVPPNKHLQMEDGNIVVHPNIRQQERRAPVDIFFRTLAESHSTRAIAVILSGTGANGSMGLKRIKEKGGAVFVQSPREAAHNEMPRQAIATGLVDDIQPVALIPTRLLTYQRGLGTVAIPEEALQRPEDQQQALREVFTQLRLRTGHDFSNYKRPTLLRRLERRISIHNLLSLPAYAVFLREHPDETQALLKDLLISVTNFFRDEKVFQHLEQHLIPLLTRSDNSREILRIWVAGCATGEEAYSLAMMCAERTLGGIDSPKVQIFATDIDEDAIAIAREGLYTLNDAADVSPERLRRFFTQEGQEYRIRREIREMILFAHHNVLKDPPFSQLDMVSCRNLMIYFNPVAQERVMETFHFALRPGGYLLLGMSETVDGSNDLYATVNREHHLYQCRQVSTRSYPVPESIPQLPQLRKRPLETTNTYLESRATPRVSYGDMHQRLLEQYAPPSIVINEEYDVLHISERAGRYLQMVGGEPSKNLLKLIRPEMRLEMRTALYQATQQQANVDMPQITLNIDNKPETIILHIRPVMRTGDPAQGFILVLFEPTSDGQTDQQPVITPVKPMVQQLEEELIRAKTQLRSANEHYELQAEELKASNEELQAMNEELRSAAEELETGKEEMQSINEELTTVNQELKVKVEEASLTSNNLQNLINSTDMATLFLDRSFQVKLFTPATRYIFNLIPSDLGRPLSDITNRLTYQDLQVDAETVLNKLQPLVREVDTVEGRTFIMRVLPYRTAEDRINGIVLTFVDITDRKSTETALRKSEEMYRDLFNSIDEGFCTIEVKFDEHAVAQDYRFLEVNPAFERQTGLANAVGQWMRKLAPGYEQYWFDTYGQIAKTGQEQRFEGWAKPMKHWYDVYAFRVGEPGENRVGIIFQNITQRKQQEATLRASEAHQKFMVQLSDALRSLKNPTDVQTTAARILGEHLSADEAFFAVYDESGHVKLYQDYVRAKAYSTVGHRAIAESRSVVSSACADEACVYNDTADMSSLTAEERASYAVLGIRAVVNKTLVKNGMNVAAIGVTSITPRVWTKEEVALVEATGERTWVTVERMQAEEALRQSEQRLATIRPLTLLGQTEALTEMGSWEYHRSTGTFSWSEGMYRLFGIAPEHAVQPSLLLDVAPPDGQHNAWDLLAYLYEGEGSMETELQIQVDGRIRTLRFKADVIGEDSQLRVLGVGLDITDQLTAQQQIRETAENLQAVLNSSPAAISLLKAVHDPADPTQVLDFWLAVGNDKLAQLFNQSLDNLLGKPSAYLADLLWNADTLTILRELYYNHEFRYEERPMPAPNQDRWMALSVTQQDDGIVLTGLDITDLKRFQQQQQHWLSEVEASRHSVEVMATLRTSLNQRTELLRSISHDLRGNFGVINGALQLLGMADTESDRTQMMDMVLRNVNQATGLLTDLLDLGRLETGQQQRLIAPFDVAQLLQELSQSLRPVAEEQRLELDTTGPAELIVSNDRQLVYRMAQNILINAIKYTSEGGVRIHWGQLDDRWWFEVIDTGPGLAEELVESLNANKFVQGRPTGPVSEDTLTSAVQGPADVKEKKADWTRLRGEGIGLRIVRELSALLEAQLQVSSTANSGTHFRVSIPLHYT